MSDLSLQSDELRATRIAHIGDGTRALGDDLAAVMPKDRPIAIICLGNPLHPIDLFGPNVGTWLQIHGLPSDVVCYGTTDEPAPPPCPEMGDYDAMLRREMPEGAWILMVDVGDGKRGLLYLRGAFKPAPRWLLRVANWIMRVRGGRFQSGWVYHTGGWIGDASLILGCVPPPTREAVYLHASRAVDAILYALEKRSQAQ